MPNSEIKKAFRDSTEDHSMALTTGFVYAMTQLASWYLEQYPQAVVYLKSIVDGLLQ